jgi:hypothetical protein
MNTSSDHPRQPHSSAWGNLILTWVVILVGVSSVFVSAGYVFNENLRAYALCAEHQHPMCSNTGWYSSMALSLGGGIVAVTAGAFLGLRRYGNGRQGVWFPIAAVMLIGILTAVAIAILKFALPR